MTPIERAARAMYDTVNPAWDWNDPDAEPLRRMYRDNARAAVLAIRVPTKAMSALATMLCPHLTDRKLCARLMFTRLGKA